MGAASAFRRLPRKATAINPGGFRGDVVSHHTIDWTQAVLGGALFWLPGLLWTWLWTPRMPWAYRLPLSIVVAFTVEPALMMLLHLLLRVPLDIATAAFLAAALSGLGIGLALLRARPRLSLDDGGLRRR